MSRTSNPRHSALLMAVYTFLLVLGAAMPIAASYANTASPEAADGRIQSGGYQRRGESTEDAGDETQTQVRPMQHRSATTAGLEGSSVTDVDLPPAREWLDHSRFRGS